MLVTNRRKLNRKMFTMASKSMKASGINLMKDGKRQNTADRNERRVK